MCFTFFLKVDCQVAILRTFLECVNGVVLMGHFFNRRLLVHVDPSVFLMLLHHDSFIFFLMTCFTDFEECVFFSALNQIDVKVVTTSGASHNMTASEFILRFDCTYSTICLFKRESLFYASFKTLYIEGQLDWITDLLQPSLASEQSQSEAQVSEQENNQSSITQEQSDASENTLSFLFSLLTIIVRESVLNSMLLWFEHLHDHSIKCLLSELNCATKLCDIRLQNLGMSSELAVPLAMVLDHVPCLQMLNLTSNPLGCGVSVLAFHLQSVPQLRYLMLDHTDMSEREATDLAKTLQHVPLLEQLHLNNNSIGRGLIPVAENLIHVPELVFLNLANTNLTEREAADLGKALQHVPLLEGLYLNWNPIGHGLIFLNESLIHVPELRILNLAGTSMTEREATDLAKVLLHVPLLEELYLDCNSIGCGIIPLAENLTNVPNLSDIGIKGMDAECKAALKKANQDIERRTLVSSI